MSKGPAWRNAIASMIGLFALYSIYLSIRADLDSRFLGSESRGAHVDRFLHTDAVMVAASDGKGLLLRFDTEHTTPQQWSHLPQAFYFRAVYLLYPQPVLVNDPSIPIDDVLDVLNSKFNPDDTWLMAHGIGAILTFSKSTGQLQTDLRRVGTPTTQP